MDPAPGPADKVWNEYFRTHKSDPRAVCDVVLRLHQAKRTEDVISCINAALTQGRSQPWMYTVLALEMDRAGKPKEDIERVLLSNIDFSAINVDNLLYSGAFLTRYGAKVRAIGLYRQASLIDPTRLEPYVLSLKLAREAADPEAVSWAACGILQRAWGRDHEQLHKEARAAATELEELLRKGGNEAAADRLSQDLADASVIDMRIELTWSGKADLDLLVEDPSGAVCSSENPSTSGGGIFIHDGYGANQKDCHDDYVCPRGLSGDYRVTVRHVTGEVVGKRAVLNVTRYLGTSREITDQFTVKLAETDKVVRISLQNGRLKELTDVPLLKAQREAVGVAQQRRQETLIRGNLAQKRAEARLAADAGRNRQPAANPGYQPLITVLSDGISMTTMAVVTGDRRYVRLSMQPTFSAVTDLATFTFFQSGSNSNTNQSGGGIF
ncbi:MAG: hypothetical protein JSS02_01790 [Planctomycetes bacterium]|nr:hypothetical protein [Planctomycetota bacterium]